MTLKNLDKAPFPWFGGKSKAADVVWAALGDVGHYVEPFAGSCAVLLNRPHPCNRPYSSETVNDLDGLVVNAWRSIQWHPEATAEAASWPVSEADKTARQIAILQWRTDRMLERLAGDATFCDPTIGGWWLWAVCAQIGAFEGNGPWTMDPETGRIYKQPHRATATREPGVSHGLPHLSNNGRGVNHAGTREPGVSRDLPHVSSDGRGVNRPGVREPGVSRDLPHVSDDGRGVNHAGVREPGVSALDALAHADTYHDLAMPELVRWMRHLSARLRHVRILNGQWNRAVTTGAAHTLTVRQGKTPVGVFLDPPYDNNERSGGLYSEDDGTVAADCREWARTVADNPQWRIVIAGYDTEHNILETEGWTAVEWYTAGHLTGGYGNGTKDGHQQHRERLWLSPHCLNTEPEPDPQLTMFDED